MKRRRTDIQLLFVLTATVMMTLLPACSGDALLETTTPPATPEEPQAAPADTALGTADSLYLNLHISLAADNATAPYGGGLHTRATEADENAIYDGILVLFEGSSPATATLKSAVVIDQLINAGKAATFSIRQRLPRRTAAYTDTYKPYVLALLNTSATKLHVADNTLYDGTTNLTGKTVSYFTTTLILDTIGSETTHKGFFMANRPDQAADDYLPEATALFDTEAKASAAGAASTTIHIERAAAKVQAVNHTTSPLKGGTLTGITLNGTSDHPKVHTVRWALTHYNTQCHALRNTTEGATAGTAPWAKDINYDDGSGLHHCTAADFNVYSPRSHDLGDIVYIAENTTSAAAMETPDNVTAIVVEVRLKDASSVLLDDCYTFSPNSPATNLYTNPAHLLTALKAWWTSTGKDIATYTDIASQTADQVFLAPTILLATDGTVTLTLDNDGFTPTQKTALNTLATSLSGMLHGYKQGKMYYTLPICHNTTVGTGNLGYHGIVRNNAYQQTLAATATAFTQLGTTNP